MINNFLKLSDVLKSPGIGFYKKGLKELFQDYCFFHISQNESLEKEKKIVDNLKISKAVVIDRKQKLNEYTNKDCVIIGFEKTIIISEQPLLKILDDIELIHYIPIIGIDTNKNPATFQEEIKNFNSNLKMKNTTRQINEVWSIVVPSISGYLIYKNYETNKNIKRVKQFIEDYTSFYKPENITDESEYIELRNVGIGNTSACSLIYHIKLDKLCVVKKSKYKELVEREKSNYLKLRHPFLPKFYGNVDKNDYFIIEFIQGESLSNIKKLLFDKKLIIIFELMLIIKYFHDREMIYRDLKPNDIIINDEYNMLRFVLIDLDRLIEINSINDSTVTGDLNPGYSGPEVIECHKYTYKSDIYSLGKIIKYIQDDIQSIDNKDTPNSAIQKIIQECTQEDEEKRPNISDLINEFISEFNDRFDIESFRSRFSVHYKLIKDIIDKFENLDSNHDDPKIQFTLGKIYNEGIYVYRDFKEACRYLSLAANQNSVDAQLALADIFFDDFDKSNQYYLMAANQNNSDAQYILGARYYEESSYRNIKKAIYYLTLAANNNHPKAQFVLGSIYYYGKYTIKDIDKAIYYLELAAYNNHPEAHLYLGHIYYHRLEKTGEIDKVINHFCVAAENNFSIAQYYLGLIYYEGIYVTRDVDLAKNYFSLAADQNDPEAQYNLGYIYYVARDMNKAIKYISLSAKNNCIEAQYMLGVLYMEGRYVVRDIYKAIYYFKLAANQNDLRSLCNLGFIYYYEQFDDHDPNKAIKYLTQAANQNHLKSQCLLGGVYLLGKYVKPDINKAIHYFSLAAKRNYSHAQYILGDIYFYGKYVQCDINKAIYYNSLAASQNHSDAQFELGIIYYTGRFSHQDIKKGIKYILQASVNNNRQANFAHGFLLHEGKYIDRNIEKAIHYYKQASSFNNQYAKNNLGIIFKHGDGDKVKKNISLAIEYFEEAIQKTNDYLSMYNLANIYIFDESRKNIDKSIELLIKSLNYCSDSMILLCLLLVTNEIDFETIKTKIKQYYNDYTALLTQTFKVFNYYKSFEKTVCQFFFDNYKNKELAYNIDLEGVILQNNQNNEAKNNINSKKSKAKNITSLFYEGFGIDL
ncbi:hypothetical protein M9Y10_025826 [Tritrichomonas musculus]|uniref:Protein kinase domain-containing protein n=1 Tax=Tritrichomonas musculus TaxID=1915356 RepID=A0ABR2HC49_9EUKA